MRSWISHVVFLLFLQSFTYLFAGKFQVVLFNFAFHIVFTAFPRFLFYISGFLEPFFYEFLKYYLLHNLSCFYLLRIETFLLSIVFLTILLLPLPSLACTYNEQSTYNTYMHESALEREVEIYTTQSAGSFLLHTQHRSNCQIILVHSRVRWFWCWNLPKIINLRCVVVFCLCRYYRIHCNKRLADIPSPAGMSLPNSPWPGIIYRFLARGSLVSDISAGDGKIANLFYSVLL